MRQLLTREHAVAIAVVIATMFLLDAWSVPTARLPRSDATARGFHRSGKAGWFLWPLGILLLCWRLSIPGHAPLRGSSHGLGPYRHWICLHRDRAAEPVCDHHQNDWRARRSCVTTSGPMSRSTGMPATSSVRPCHHGLRGAGRHWRDFPGEGADVDLRRPDRAQPGHHRRIIRSGVIAAHRWRRRRAVLVRNWFADRRLGFAVPTGGSVRAMPGPSFGRIIKAVARRLHSA
jgi:hypothetical protein